MALTLLDVVVLKKSLPQHKLLQGAIGTVIEILDKAHKHFLVEFADTKGIVYAIVDLNASQLMKVVHEPIAV
jgi:Domain of unknown function (DUF4926)